MISPSLFCPVLASLKAIPLGDLMAMVTESSGANDFSSNTNSAIKATEEHCSASIMAEQLAQVIYFEQGRIYATAGKWNDLTRLQLECEAVSQGLSNPEDIRELSDWHLRLKLASSNYQPTPLCFA